jgi:hypothetical protein
MIFSIVTLGITPIIITTHLVTTKNTTLVRNNTKHNGVVIVGATREY